MRLSTCLPALLLSCITLAADGQSRWEVVSEGPERGGTRRHDDVKFVEGGIGWLVNTGGEIWRTDDAGRTWARQLDAAGVSRFRSVAPLDEFTLFAGTVLTPGSVLFTSSDGGATWTDVTNRISGSQPAGICGMVAVNQQVLYGVGAFHGAATIIKTTNGGITWTGRSLRPLVETAVDVHFFDEQVGIVAGGTSEDLDGTAVVLRTQDGGATWEKVYETKRASGISGEWGWKISFPSRDIGYVSVEYGTNDDGRPAKVLKTVDGGLTWSEIEVTGSISTAGLQAIGFVTEEIGWASGRGVTSVTTDGGATWTQLRDWSEQSEIDSQGNVISSPDGQLDGSVNRIVAVNDTFAVAVGRRVYRLLGSPTATGNERTPIPEQFELEGAYPNPFSTDLTLSFRLHSAAYVGVEVIDVLGRPHRGLVGQTMEAGSHSVTWDGRDSAGRQLPSGAYFLLIDIGNSPEMKQVVLIR